MDTLDALHKIVGALDECFFITLVNKNASRLKWNIHFYYILKLTTHFQSLDKCTFRMGS